MVPLAAWLLAAVAAPTSSGVPPIPADYELQWSAPAECPDAALIRDRIAALRGDHVGGEGIAVVAAEITNDADGYALELTTRFAASTHTRQLRATQCAELGESTAIIVAVALRQGVEAAMRTPAAIEVPEIVARPQPITTTPRTTSPVASAPTMSASEDVAPFDDEPPLPRRSRSIAEPLLRVEGVGEIGALGVITGGARAVLGLAWPRARLEISGLYLAPRRRALGDGRGALFQAGAAIVRGCWVPRAGALALPLCAGVEAGTVRADNRGITPTKTLHTPWAGPTLGAGLLRAVGPVRLWVGVDAVVRIVGTNFRVDGEVQFPQWPVSLRWALGLEIPLGRRSAGPTEKKVGLR